ncbi:hypothetical protein [Roseibium litorale]|uniref:Uncharacterized protein n=1 Tax=Roseibium litorale TaxID=2803841 RepID=A0ABR9CKI5_9HYPH|nr:hypothetical protein [Roseibium litorale]MBD8891365.1 hypothetical protein [Roseibium litorale]
MSARYPLDPFALPNRPDIPISASRDAGRRAVPAGTLLKTAATVILITIGLATAVFLPALLLDVSRVDHLVLDGRMMTLPAYSARVIDMFLGALVVAIALVSFVLSAMICASERSEWSRSDRRAARKHGGSQSKRTGMIEVLDV